jgi:hypothetical protein
MSTNDFDEPILLRMPFDDGTIRELKVTAEQAMDVMRGRTITWRSPEVPDLSVDEAGTIIEHEDARPQPRD